MRQWANGQYDKDLDGLLWKELRDKQDIIGYGKTQQTRYRAMYGGKYR